MGAMSGKAITDEVRRGGRLDPFRTAPHAWNVGYRNHQVVVKAFIRPSKRTLRTYMYYKYQTNSCVLDKCTADVFEPSKQALDK